MRKRLIIFGNINTAKEIFEFVRHSESYQFQEIQMLYYNEKTIVDDLSYPKDDLYYIISFSDVQLREACLKSISKLNIKPVSIIHDTAYISPSATIGEGVYIAANVTVSTDAVIHNHVLINLNATIGHDANVESNSIILPGARISGNCQIGKGTIIGSNAFIYKNLIIGEYNQIDALCYISKDLKPKMISSVRHATKTIRQIK